MHFLHNNEQSKKKITKIIPLTKEHNSAYNSIKLNTIFRQNITKEIQDLHTETIKYFERPK